MVLYAFQVIAISHSVVIGRGPAKVSVVQHRAAPFISLWRKEMM